jgi:hypothetical protein
MRTILSGQVLRDFLGHRSVGMTDHYDNPILMERLSAYQSVRPSIEQFWSNGTDEKKSSASKCHYEAMAVT